MSKTTLREFTANIVENKDAFIPLPSFSDLKVGEMFRYIDGGTHNIFMKAFANGANGALYLRTGDFFLIAEEVKIIRVNEITIKAS